MTPRQENLLFFVVLTGALIVSIWERLIGNIQARVYLVTGDRMKGYRTMLVGLGYSVLGAALLIWGPADQVDLALGLIASGVTFAGLRSVTDSPLGKPE